MANYKEEFDVLKNNYLINCNDNSYNTMYSKAIQNLNGVSPTLPYIAYCFFVDAVIQINRSLQEKYKKAFEITPLENNTIQEILKISKKANLTYSVNSNGIWNKTDFFDVVREELDFFISSLDSCKSEFVFVDFNEMEKYLLLSYNQSDKQKENNNPFPMFSDIIGLEKAKKAVKEKVIEPAIHREVYNKYGIKIGGGILLFGPPGTGKTMFAQAVANEIEGKFYSIKSSDLKSKYFGETEKQIKELFEDAKKQEVAVIFFDEFEAIGVSRDRAGTEVTSNSVVPELLSQMQGFEKNKNILLVIAATNRPWHIDSALLRPGRLDSLIYVDLPNKEARNLMFNRYLSKINAEEDIIEYLAGYTDGYNGSDIKAVCDYLIRIVINKEIEKITNYEITFEDCVSVLKECKSSVTVKDIENMSYFINNTK